MEAIAVEEIRAQVRKFWDLFSRKDKSSFDRLYAPMATVFAADARRCEPARLMLMRRARELFAPACAVAAQLGDINVQVLAPNLAVANYSFHFSLTRNLANGSRVHLEVPFARATQVFHRNESGGLMIIHEHMSSAEPVKPETLPAESALQAR
jgi:ketosteroid isomerase-like protein